MAYAGKIPELTKKGKNSYKSFVKESSKQIIRKVWLLIYTQQRDPENDRPLSADGERKGQNSRILKPCKMPFTNQVEGKIFAKKQEFTELPMRSTLEINLQPDSKLIRKTAGKGKMKMKGTAVKV